MVQISELKGQQCFKNIILQELLTKELRYDVGIKEWDLKCKNGGRDILCGEFESTPPPLLVNLLDLVKQKVG